ncbi:MAG: SAM-dependent DNA methyltransferase [Planctomycetaceae bacterium]|nr:SAM-dependent DNA methyltransferase [Planctomycetaceae bacterium]
MSAKKEFGDFQTPESLASRVVALVDELFGKPEVVIEPTCGLGTFIQSAAEYWGEQLEYFGYEINKQYVKESCKKLKRFKATILHRDFFSEDWCGNLTTHKGKKLLLIGNPPWVTNSELGQLGSQNLPKKSNAMGLRGFDAQTGKSNFDIAEWMLIRLIESLPDNAAMAMLCKTMTARKVLKYFWKTQHGLNDAKLFRIDAKQEFNVSVDACLFFVRSAKACEPSSEVYADLDLKLDSSRFGFVDGDLVSDIDAYRDHQYLDGDSVYTWRSGVKHDAAKVMEFNCDGDELINGYGETIDIEQKYLYPLLKSSDLGNGRTKVRKKVLLTQRKIGDETLEIKENAPKTWEYLVRHQTVLDGRKSSIYKKRPRFSVFGIGPYSFAPWKVAVSGLYKSISFVVVPPVKKRPVMVDDTCYCVGCHSQEEAELIHDLLSSEEATTFLSSLIFSDSKRPITIDVLRRLSLEQLARRKGRFEELVELVNQGKSKAKLNSQMLLFN